MSDFMAMLFGPLNKEWCNYFLYISIFMYVIFIVVIFNELIFIFNHYKTLSIRTVMHGALMLINAFLAYMVNRLLYTMCVKSIL